MLYWLAAQAVHEPEEREYAVVPLEGSRVCVCVGGGSCRVTCIQRVDARAGPLLPPSGWTPPPPAHPTPPPHTHLPQAHSVQVLASVHVLQPVPQDWHVRPSEENSSEAQATHAGVVVVGGR